MRSQVNNRTTLSGIFKRKFSRTSNCLKDKSVRRSGSSKKSKKKIAKNSDKIEKSSPSLSAEQLKNELDQLSDPVGPSPVDVWEKWQKVLDQANEASLKISPEMAEKIRKVLDWAKAQKFQINSLPIIGLTLSFIKSPKELERIVTTCQSILLKTINLDQDLDIDRIRANNALALANLLQNLLFAWYIFRLYIKINEKERFPDTRINSRIMANHEEILDEIGSLLAPPSREMRLLDIRESYKPAYETDVFGVFFEVRDKLQLMISSISNCIKA